MIGVIPYGNEILEDEQLTYYILTVRSIKYDTRVYDVAAPYTNKSDENVSPFSFDTRTEIV